MLWNQDTKFTAVLVRAADQTIVHQRLPQRDTVEESKKDLECYFHRCSCYKEPRETGCLRYTNVEPSHELIDYIDNDRGARSFTYKAA